MSNPTELPDLDRLDPCPFCGGPARIESSAMWLDLICDHDKACILDGDSAEMSYQHAAGSLEAMVAKWNRRAQPEGEARCVICGSTEPRTGTCGSDDQRALCKAPAGKPEGEAPQADWQAYALNLRAVLERGYKSLASASMARTRDGEAAWYAMGEALAVMPPAAQHAESGAQTTDLDAGIAAIGEMCRSISDDEDPQYIVLQSAMKKLRNLKRAAQSQGAQATDIAHRIADRVVRHELKTHSAIATVAEVELRAALAAKAEAPAAQQAAAPGALDVEELTRLRRLMAALGMDGSLNASDEYVRGIMCTVLGQAADTIERSEAETYSAPGTPEAPAGTDAKDAARYQWLRERWVGWRETDEARSTSAYRKREKLDEWIDRAAQLDGGQGEGAGHVE